jgi:tRNA(fMet)-specific endonuclease VapC
LKYLLDTDHLSVLQQQAGSAYAALSARIARQQPADLALSVVSFHEQILGCRAEAAQGRAVSARTG